jgi:hypothetical protein
MPLHGKIESTPLPDVLEQLRRERATGSLSVRCGEETKAVYFKDGQIVFATSSDVRDRLGETLVRYGKLSREGLERALEQYQKNAGLKKLGAILVEAGLVSPKDLFLSLKSQVKDIIYSLFLRAEGAYQFEERLPPDIIHLPFHFEELIAEIIQRIKQEA